MPAILDTLLIADITPNATNDFVMAHLISHFSRCDFLPDVRTETPELFQIAIWKP